MSFSLIGSLHIFFCSKPALPTIVFVLCDMEQRNTDALNSPRNVNLSYFYFNFSYGCVYVLTLREDHRVTVCEHRQLRRMFQCKNGGETGKWVK